ncbi:MAG: tetratricopeptide repeat protein [Balneolaceae bacterium]|nr:tetratricopeptide repeat protein [Balneolaceae bacterium]
MKSNPDSASVYFEKSQKIIDPDQSFIQYTILLREKAKLQEQQNKLRQALKLYQEIEQLATDRENDKSYLDARIDQAKILLKLNNIDEAKPIVNEIANSDLTPLYFLNCQSQDTRSKFLGSDRAIR